MNNNAAIIIRTNKLDINAIDRIVIYAFLVSTAYARIVDNNAFVLLFCTVCLSAAGAWNLSRAIINNDYKMPLLAMLMVITWIIELLGRPEWHYEFNSLISSLCYLGIAYSFLTNERKVEPYKLLYYAISLYILIQIVIFKTPYSAIMKEGSSYNYVSVLLVFFLLLLNIIQIQNGKEPGFVPAGFFLLTTVLCYGRGGIVTALVYCFLLALAKCIIHKNKAQTYILMMSIIGCTLIFGQKALNMMLKGGLLNKFLRFGMSGNGRIEMWSSYLNTCTKSVRLFLLGGDPNILNDPTYNTHNSFLQVYAAFGLVMLIVFLVLLFKRTVKMMLNKEYWLLVVTATFVIRAMTDKLMCRGFNEIVFYLIVFGNAVASYDDEIRCSRRGINY